MEAKKLQKDSLLADVQLLEQALSELHPGIYRYNTPESLAKQFGQLKAAIDEGMTEQAFMIKLAQTIVKIRCGHTYLNPWNMKRELRERLFGGAIYFPLGFDIVDGHFYVTENATKQTAIQRGAEILSINGHSIQTVYDSLKTIAKYDGNNAAPIDSYLSLNDYRVRGWKAFDLYFHLFFPVTDEKFTIEYRNYGATTVSKGTLTALKKEERATLMQEVYGSKVLEQENWTLDIINDELAVLKLGTFAIWNWKDFDHKVWFANTFKKLDSLKIKTLAIDIRGNGGGLSDPRDELMSYLVQEPFTCVDQGKVLIRTIKLNPDLLPYIDTWVKPLIQGLPKEYYEELEDGYYLLKEKSGCQDINPRASGFKGKIYIFGGPSNVSATFTLLKRAQEKGIATIIGAPSGGNRQGINGGEYAFFYMPYSQMEVDIPLKFFTSEQPQADMGILPDFPIQVTQKSIAEQTDPYLDFVLKQSK